MQMFSKLGLMSVVLTLYLVVNQESDDKFVKITMKIPGLKVKFLTKSPKNGRVLKYEYNRSKVSVTLVLNEDRADRKQTYVYESREPLKMNIQEEGSYFKVGQYLLYLFKVSTR